MKQTQSKNILALLTFISTLLLSHSIGEIFYNSIDGTDFYRYFRYIEYFMGDIESPSREQGIFYFWVISLFIKYSHNFYIPEYWEFIYSSAIQFGNLLFYIIGVIGICLLLRARQISWDRIFLSCSLLNFFPPVLGGRLIMKPEIIAFAFLPWIIYSLEVYFEKDRKGILIFTSFLMSLILTSKGTVALISIFALFVIFFKKLQLIKLKDLILPTLILLVSTYLLYFENFNINTISMLNHQEQDSYLNKAPLSFIYNINFLDLISNPYRNFHANSMVGITLIDLFNDYFNRYWEHSRSLFILDRIEVFSFLKHPRRNLSLVLSIFFIVLSFTKNNKFKYLYVSGIFILLLTSIGIFGLHFNPEKGDTVKTHYYFFLLGISFIFVVLDLLKGKKFWLDYLKTISMIIIFLFILGFPKSYTSSTSDKLLEKLPTTVSCSYSKIYFNNLLSSDILCLDKEIATCGYIENFNKPELHPDGYLIFEQDLEFTPKNLVDADGYAVTVNGYAECLHYSEGGYFPNNGKFIIDRTPFYNNVFIYIVLISIAGIRFSSRSEKNYSSS